ARYPGRAIEVVNAGADGYTSADSLIALALRGLALAPDVVVVYDAINDLRADAYAGFRPDYAHESHRFEARVLDEGRDRSGARGRVAGFLEAHSLLWLALVNRLDRGGGDAGPRRGDLRLARLPPAPLPSVAAHVRNLVSLA